MDTVVGSNALHLGFGLGFSDFYSRKGLARLDAAFLSFLETRTPERAAALTAARAAPDALTRKAEADLMLALAPEVDAFVGQLFGVEGELAALRAAQDALGPLFAAKRLFVQRKALKAIKPEAADGLDGAALTREIEACIGGAFDEETFARAVIGWMDAAETHAADLDGGAKFSAWTSLTPAGQRAHGKGVLFVHPGKRDPMALVHAIDGENGGIAVREAPPEAWRRREGFALTDRGADLAHALDQGNYCIACHNQGKDSCSTGMTDRTTGARAINPLGRAMAGCPLEERISEMIAGRLRASRFPRWASSASTTRYAPEPDTVSATTAWSPASTRTRCATRSIFQRSKPAP